MILRMLVSMFLIIGLIGCATTKKGSSANVEITGLQEKISDLEKELQEKDEEIADLQERLSQAKISESEDALSLKEVDMSKVTPKDIQTALRNAGFYSGAIDGKIGRKTKEAIKEFQKSNGLKADGIIGKQSWGKLQKYLE